jgi:alpha-1,3-rhamnosyltransferase
MADMPLVSVVIPCYNHENYVQECIQSVINQDYSNIELIIIDDGSSDHSVEKINEMIPGCEKRFVRFEFRVRGNKGLSETLNEATEWSKGKYLSTIASDDILFPNKTSVLVEQLEGDYSIAGAFSGCQLIDQAGKIIGHRNPPARCYSFDEIIMRKHIIIAPAQLLRIECVKAVGGYPSGLYIEDWYMWLALTQKGYKLKVVEGELVQYRQHDANISKDALKMHKGRVRILECFSENPLWNKAMAQIFLVASLDFTAISKSNAFKLLVDGVWYNKKIIFSYWFFKTFLMIVTPRSVISLIKGLVRWFSDILVKMVERVW